MSQEPVPAIPLPAPSAVAAGPAAGPGVIEVFLAGLVVALAFLLASTPARNSDLWLHLASGRALLRGESVSGTDPFASTTAGASWVDRAWLADVALYGLHELGGGRALVVAKGLLVALLAGLFLGFRRAGTGAGVVTLAAAAAVLALGPWLLLQPMLLSAAGVALTLYLLERPARVEDSRADRARARRWLLVPLFALWANLDGWFVLGPALVGLYALGELPRPAPRRDFAALALLALAGTAACLLTPYHYRTFAWPTPLGLSSAERAWMRDPLGRGLVVSPFGARGMAAPAFASPGGWAYCLLLAAGAASFAVGGRWRAAPGRLLAWLALAALSAYQARAIPFFAAAAGPILALNLQEWTRLREEEKRRRGEEEKRRNTERLSRLLFSSSPLLLFLLLVLAWPGWLQPAPHQPRGWAAEPDGSLVRLARELGRRHADWQSHPGHVALTFSPEVAHHLAWFCPSEKGFFDSRWPLFDGVADDFVRVRRCLLEPDGTGPDRQLGPLLDRYRVDRIILYDPGWERTAQAYRCLLGGAEWELLDVEGGAALFGRRSVAEPPWEPFDYRRAAYHPEPGRRAPPDAPRPPEPPRWYDAFWRARDDRSPDRAEAALHLISFDQAAERTRAELGTQWLLGHAAGLLAPAPAGGPGATAAALAARLDLIPMAPTPSASQEATEGQQAAAEFAAGFLASRDRGPPEALLLAVRAARRALAANPDDAGAFLLLGEAYLRLARQTREEGWQALLPGLAAIRHAQVVTALEQAALRGPDLDRPHALLAELYYEDGQMDRSLDHLRAHLRIVEQEYPKLGADAAERPEALRAHVSALEDLVHHSQETYAANTEGLAGPSKVFDRARLASRHGLSRKALEMLLESHPAIFGKSGAQMQLELMLQAGRAFEVRAWLEPDHEAVLGYSPYHWLQLQAAAACGDYAAADAELDRLTEEVRQVAISRERHVPVRTAVALRVAGAVLARPAPEAGPPGLAGALFQQFEALQPLAGPGALLRKEADFRVLRGLLALEEGDVETAREHFRAAVDVWGDPGRAAVGGGLDFPARPIAQEVLGRLEAEPRGPAGRR